MSDHNPDSTPVQLPFDSTEEWRDVPGYEEIYAVSNLGRVKRLAGSKLGRGYLLKQDRMLTPSPDSAGYMGVKLCYRRHSVHQLVMIAFVGPTPDMEVNHINLIRSDNRLKNLEYLTHQQNMQHSVDLGSFKHKKKSAKLNAKDIPHIRRLAKQGHTLTDIAQGFGVCHTAIRAIVIGKTWKHIK